LQHLSLLLKDRKMERIAKVIARSGHCSRREAEKLIIEGKVMLDGQLITSPALNVPTDANITIDGKPLAKQEETRLWLYYKPTDLITTHKDTEGRKTVFESLPPEMKRVISIGRLDINTEGLLLLTNNGELARHLELPSTGWIRRYRVRVYGNVDEAKLASLKNGLSIEDEKTGKEINYKSIGAKLDSKPKGKNAWITISISEGKNREVRKICQHLGLQVNRLIRLSYGPFLLGNLEPGEFKEVSRKVIKEQIGGFV